MGGLTAGADVTGGHKLPGVGFDGGPPKASTDKLHRPSGPRVAGQPAGVSPLKDLAADGRGDKQTVGWTPSRIGVGALSHPYRRFDPPCDDTHHPGRREDGVYRGVIVRGPRGEQPR